jgi:hypothetical protein
MEPEATLPREAIERYLNRDAARLDELLADPRFADLAAAGPSAAEVFVVTFAVYLFGLVFPLAALAFAAANLRTGAGARPLFLSAAVSSTLALVAGIAVWLLPVARPGHALAQDWRSVALMFLYAWALLDFWRGARLTGARPRVPALIAGFCLAWTVLAVPIIGLSR